MNWLIVLMLMVVAAVVWGWTRGLDRPTPSRAADRPQMRKRSSPWQSVSIASGDGPCAAVMAMSGKRFLAREAPTLPLPGCDAPHCNCRYEYFGDRRDGTDRRALRSASIREMDELKLTHERTAGRRKDDHS